MVATFAGTVSSIDGDQLTMQRIIQILAQRARDEHNAHLWDLAVLLQCLVLENK